MSEKKNICITINSLVDGGAEKQSLLLAKAIQSHYAATLVILNPEPIYAPRLKIIEEENINHVFLSKNPVKKYFEFIYFIKKNKIAGNKISRQRQLSGDFHVVWLFRDAVPNESHDGIKKSKRRKVEKKAASFSICVPWIWS